jgi:hypothetical protein
VGATPGKDANDPFSLIGRRAGHMDVAGLWPAIREVRVNPIRESRPYLDNDRDEF